MKHSMAADMKLSSILYSCAGSKISFSLSEIVFLFWQWRRFKLNSLGNTLGAGFTGDYIEKCHEGY